MFRNRNAQSLLFLALCVFTPSANAEPSEACAGLASKAYQIISGDGLGTFKTRSGAKLRLIGLDFPEPSRYGKEKELTDLAVAVRSRLSRLIGATVKIAREPAAKQDRFGALGAQIFRLPGGNWIQRDLIRDGLARLYPVPGETHCVKNLFKDERYARKNKLGLWGLPEFRHQDAQDSALINRAGRFQGVIGRIKSVGKTKRRVYLNFGKDWSTDFTASMSARIFKRIEASGLSQKRLDGAKVLIRGWLEKRRGPYIEVYVAEQIELIENAR